MNPSAPFIRRPVATTLLTLGIALAGLLSFFLLPVAPLPQVDFPTIVVIARLPGASADTMAATVAMPLERQLGRIDGLTEMTSSSSLGITRIILQFDLGRNIDGAARDVQAAFNAARSLLPSNMPTNPIYRKANPADSPILILALTSKTRPPGQLYDAASTVLAQKLAQVEGIGQVELGGSALPAVRVDLHLDAVNKYGLGLEDIRNALAGSNANRPKGAVEQGDHRWQIYTNDQLKEARDYLPQIISYRNGIPVRLGDVARVHDSVQDLRNAGTANGLPAVLLVMRRQPGANVIDTVDRVKAVLPQLKASIPQDINISTQLDQSETIRISLAEVEETLIISTVLVLLVVLLFLHSTRAALIPAIALPISLIGSFIVMYFFDYTIDNLSLMALTIATGFVVDDVIVVLENIIRHIEKGMSPYKAALIGTQEVSFTVVSMSLSLVAVFLPILLMGGMVGRLFREFGATLSIAVLVSMVISLTTIPTLSARLLRPAAEEHPNRIQRAAERLFARAVLRYQSSLDWALRHSFFTLMMLFATFALNIYLFIIVPKGLMPQQDIGKLLGYIQAEQNVSFQALQRKQDQFVDIIRSDPAVESVVSYIGGETQANGGFMFISLVPLEQRKVSAEAVRQRLSKRITGVPGAQLFLQGPQDIQPGGRTTNATYQFSLQGSDLQELYTWTPRLEAAMRKLPELTDVNSDLQNKGMQSRVVINRDRATQLGITPKMVDETLYDAFGQRPVSTIYSQSNQYFVIMEAAPDYLESPRSLDHLYVRTSQGAMVPLSSFSHYEPVASPSRVNHQGQFVAATVSFNLAPGVALSTATAAIERAEAEIGMPNSIQTGFQGTALAFQQSQSAQPWLLVAALAVIYVVLGILYESYIHPITILSTLPSAGVGAILALMLFHVDFSAIALIGLFLLIGVVKKNAIMMVDVAVQVEREYDWTPRQAIYHAAVLRFRPIIMTTLAAALGALPLALSTGYAAALRQPMGISIVGGLLVSQVLTLYTTPVVYLYMDRLRLWTLRQRRKLIQPRLWRNSNG